MALNTIIDNIEETPLKYRKLNNRINNDHKTAIKTNNIVV